MFRISDPLPLPTAGTYLPECPDSNPFPHHHIVDRGCYIVAPITARLAMDIHGPLCQQKGLNHKPCILESRACLCIHPLKEIADFRVTVNSHPFREQRMAESISRIVLGTVVLFNNGVGSQVKEQAGIFCRQVSSKNLRQFIIVHDLPDHDPGPDTKCAAS